MADTRSIVQKSVANIPTISGSTIALASNTLRSSWFIQNLGTNVLYVQLGTSAATSSFHIALKAGTANDDGIGAFYSEFYGVVYTGQVTVAGTAPRYTTKETS